MIKHKLATVWRFMRFEKLSLQKRLIAIILFVTISSLLFGFGLSLFYDYRVSQVDLSTTTHVVTELISEYSVSPILFYDKTGAKEILEKLKVDPNILFCQILDPNKNEFAAYGERPHKADFEFPLEKFGTNFHGRYLYAHEAIIYNDEFIGSVFIVISTFEITSKLIKQVRNIILLLLFVFVFAGITANHLQRSVSRPIVSLAQVMGDVTKRNDFSVRVSPENDDEIGSLYDSFNAMLEQLELREQEQRTAEERLKKSEERFHHIYDNMANGVCIYDAVDDGENFRIRDMNNAGLKIGRQSRQDVIGRLITDVYPAMKEFGLFEVLQRVYNTGVPEYFPLKFYQDHRLKIWVKNFIFRLRSGEVIAVYNDDTERERVQIALRKSEERYRMLIENQLDMIVKTDMEGRFEFVSKSYCELFGKTQDELLGNKFMPLVHPEDQGKTEQAMKKLLVKPHTAYIEQRANTIHGWRWLAWVDKAVVDADGNVKEIIGVGRDITVQKNAELNLRESEERFRTLFENMVQGVFYQRKRDGFVYSANHAALEIFGLSLEQLRGRTSLHPEWKVIDESGTIIPGDQHPSMVALSTNTELRNKIVGIFNPLKKDYVWVSISAMPMFLPGESEAHQVFVTMHDITALKKAQQEIRVKSRALDLSINGFNIIDGDAKFVYVNKAYMNMWGYDSIDEILASSPEDHSIDPSTPVSIIKNLQKYGNYTIEFTAKRKDGSTFEVLMSAYLYHDEYGNEFYAGSSIDITQRILAERKLLELNRDLEDRVRKRTAQYEAVNKDLEAFAYSVSHDLRAPLRHISGYSSLLESEFKEPSKNISYFSNKIRTATKKMQEMIDDLLSFSRIGRQSLSMNPLDLKKLVNTIVSEYEHELAERDVEWKIDLHSTCMGDENLLRMVLENLISNALKFTGHREKTIIEIGEKSLENNYLEIFVKDNGVGFDNNYKEKLFNVFQRLHSEDEFPGTGIGLANVKRIIEKHEGEVWADSVLDEGASFHFTLPKETT